MDHDKLHMIREADMKKRNKSKKKHTKQHGKVHRETQAAQSGTMQSSGMVEPDTSMIEHEIELIATDTHLQHSFFDPDKKSHIGLEPQGPRPRIAHLLRDALRKHGTLSRGPKVHWKAVKYEEGHLHPDSKIRGKEIIPPDRE